MSYSVLKMLKCCICHRKLFCVLGQNSTTYLNNFTPTTRNVFLRFSSSRNQTTKVFDIKSKRLQKKRAAISEDSDVFDYLKEEAAHLLLDRLPDVKRILPISLHLDGGNGLLSKHISGQDGIDCMVEVDTCRQILEKYQSSSSSIHKIPVVADGLSLPFKDNTFDVVLSNCSLHWVNDLPASFKEVMRVMRPDGCFIAVMFGVDTLFELRCSLQLAETEREGGMGVHVSPMIQGHQLANLLYNAGFSMVTLDFDQLVVRYPSMVELMRDLQGMGENNAVVRRKPLNRDTILAAASIYQAMYGKEDHVPATFQLLFMIGWKPDKSQRKPLQPGAAPKGFNVKKPNEPAT